MQNRLIGDFWRDRLAAVLCIALVMFLLAPVSAAEKTIDEARGELQTVTDDLEAERVRLQEIREELAGLENDRAAINADLIATADRIQGYETEIQKAEERLHALGTREVELRADLASQRDVLAALLAALQRMGHHRPPAVVVSPDDALATVRSAMLLGAVVPDIRGDTEKLGADLAELLRVTKSISAERERLTEEHAKLDDDRIRLTALLDAKTRATLETQDRIAETNRRTQELTAMAADLEDLLAALEKDAERRAQEQLRLESEEAGRDERDVREALRDTGRLRPAVRFSKAQGLLPHPVAGAVIREFGAPDTYGGRAGGISIATRAKAQVTAPSDGWIAYSGPFRSYGQLLIIDAGDGYHVVLAGLESVTARVGQFVLAGEPVGQMGTLALASAVAPDGGPIQPVLYVEFRKNGRAIDPKPWWSDDPDGAEG